MYSVKITMEKRTISYQQKGSKKIFNPDTGKDEDEMYDCRIMVIDETKLIAKIDCSCWNFQNKRIVRSGKFSDTKFSASPCKHLQPVVEKLTNIGYILKQPGEMQGPDKLSAALRKKLLEKANHQCKATGKGQRCPSKTNLEIHRKVSRTNGGKYIESNCEVLCREHHDMITDQPWRRP